MVLNILLNLNQIIYILHWEVSESINKGNKMFAYMYTRK